VRASVISLVCAGVRECERASVSMCACASAGERGSERDSEREREREEREKKKKTHTRTHTETETDSREAREGARNLWGGGREERVARGGGVTWADQHGLRL
jgi:hypothetical protein